MTEKELMESLGVTEGIAHPTLHSVKRGFMKTEIIGDVIADLKDAFQLVESAKTRVLENPNPAGIPCGSFTEIERELAPIEDAILLTIQSCYGQAKHVIGQSIEARKKETAND